MAELSKRRKTRSDRPEITRAVVSKPRRSQEAVCGAWGAGKRATTGTTTEREVVGGQLTMSRTRVGAVCLVTPHAPRHAWSRSCHDMSHRLITALAQPSAGGVTSASTTGAAQLSLSPSPTMTSYLSSLIWGTSQVDDAVGEFVCLVHDSTNDVLRGTRQGNLRAPPIWNRGYRPQPRD